MIKQNTVLIGNAADTLNFNSIDELDQGAGTLYTITRFVIFNKFCFKIL